MAPGCFVEHARGEDGGGGGSGEPLAGLVHEEHAVGVAVEGEAHVEPAGQHPRLEVSLVGRYRVPIKWTDSELSQY